jgi:hypothetical protein
MLTKDSKGAPEMLGSEGGMTCKIRTQTQPSSYSSSSTRAETQLGIQTQSLEHKKDENHQKFESLAKPLRKMRQKTRMVI